MSAVPTMPVLLPEPDDVWSDSWEHARLLGDSSRTHGMVGFLKRNVPGQRVVEVGCGTGLLSCIAARLGARHVIGIEPSDRWEDAVQMVRDSGLSDRVEILRGRVEDIPPRQADVVFSELLNADPFVEGVLSAMQTASAWRAAGGIIAPYRLDLYIALVAAADVEAEVSGAVSVVGELGRAYDLDVRGLLEHFEATPPRRYVVSFVEQRSKPVLAASIPLGTRAGPPQSREFELVASHNGPVCGAALWFSAPYDDGLVLANPPNDSGHWGVQVSGWTRPIKLGKGQRLRVRVEMDEQHGVQVVPA